MKIKEFSEKIEEFSEWLLPIMGIALAFMLVKDKGNAALLMVALSGVVTFLVTMYWPRTKR